MSELTAEFVRSVLDYDPLTGVFTWRGGRRSTRAGRRAANINGKGYGYITLCGKHSAAHRVAWLYVHGIWPPKSIYVDHINGDKTDNRIANLRLATPSQNAQNRTRNLEGKKGVSFHRRLGKWQAQITPPTGTIYLGVYSSEDEAHAAYADAALRLFGEFARLG